jgi:hypothetical protein
MTASVSAGDVVRVHVNLHNGLIVIADRRTRRVLRYAHDVTLADVTFRVPAGGLATVRATGVRSVFAYAVGRVLAIDSQPDRSAHRKISFNPHRDDTFVCDGAPIHEAPVVTFADRAGWLPPERISHV